jgi:arylformamidase
MPVHSGGLVYPGNPEIRIQLEQAIARGAGANVSSIYFGSHTGTHVDAPRHFSDAGAGVDQLSLETLVGQALLVRFDDDVMSITRAHLEARDLRGHKRLLFCTRNSRLQTESRTFVPDYTYVAPDAAEYLVSLDVKLVGVDYLSVEQFHSGHHRTHHTLLDNNVIIVEGLQLSAPPEGEYQLVCLPLRLDGCDGAPARAVLIEHTRDS